MMCKRLLIPAMLGLAGLLVGVEAAQAQVRVVVGIGRPAYYPRPYYYGYGPRYYYPPVIVGAGPVIVRDYPPPLIVDAPPAIVPSPPPAPAASTVANIRVLVPNPQAKVWFDGNLTSQAGTDRLFHTPSLTGGSYSYRIRASWIQNGKEMVQEAVANVTPGQTTTVDFTRPVSEAIPAPSNQLHQSLKRERSRAAYASASGSNNQ